MDVKLRKVGNSFVVTVPLETVERLNAHEGDELVMTETSNGFSYEPKKKTSAIEWDKYTCFANAPHEGVDPVEYVRGLREDDRI